MKKIFILIIPAFALFSVLSCNGTGRDSSVQPASPGENTSGVSNTSGARDERNATTDSTGQRNNSVTNRDSSNYGSGSNRQTPVNSDNHASGGNRGSQQGTTPAGTDRSSSSNSRKDNNRSSSDTSGRRNPK
ncbi:MAG TPA: hypothetical protein VGO45_12395 [Bacteroidia bacterium]|jgi:hypothetical protein|nr:hypothetical protein [Bacteroidia bacterium]